MVPVLVLYKRHVSNLGWQRPKARLIRLHLVVCPSTSLVYVKANPDTSRTGKRGGYTRNLGRKCFIDGYLGTSLPLGWGYVLIPGFLRILTHNFETHHESEVTAAVFRR